MSDPKSRAGRPSDKAGMLGQVLTPEAVARRMAGDLLASRPAKPIQVLDPCVGPGTFPAAIRDLQLLHPDDTMTAIDIDTSMIDAARERLLSDNLCLSLTTADYLLIQFESKFDFAILNPPYIRQEWIDDKRVYQKVFYDRYGVRIPGIANLYVYFLVKSIMDLRPGGMFSSIVYDSWRSTRYGAWLIQFLQATCADLSIDPVGAQPFDGRLIDATIIRGTRKPMFMRDWISVSDVQQANVGKSPFGLVKNFQPIGETFATERGLRLKQSNFFMTGLEHVRDIGATPFVKKVGKIAGYTVPREHPEAALIVSRSRPPTKAMLEEFEQRLTGARAMPDCNVPILTWWRERPDTWFTHREPPRAPLIFNYYLRGTPRHIYNPYRAFSDNFYGLVPNDDVSVLSWLAVLNSTATTIEVLGNARSQGAGLAKIQLFEYRRAYVFNIRSCSLSEYAPLHRLGERLVAARNPALEVIDAIDKTIYNLLDEQDLKPERLGELLADARARLARNEG